MTPTCLSSPLSRREADASIHSRAVSMVSDSVPATAMVFAAGLGQRMRPGPDTIPKPLIRIAGTALIDHTLDRIAAAGVETAVVNVHYMAGAIEQHLASRRKPKIIISDERDKLLDQAG